ncbi:MAG: hypothetical protein WC683_03875 [bacterium]
MAGEECEEGAVRGGSRSIILRMPLSRLVDFYMKRCGSVNNLTWEAGFDVVKGEVIIEVLTNGGGKEGEG